MRCNPSRWLWGLIPVVMLAWGTSQRERSTIEDDLKRRAEAALADAGQHWAAVTFNGRDGVITGRAQKDGEPKAARDTVRSIWGVRTVQLRTDLAASHGPKSSALLKPVGEAANGDDAASAADAAAQAEAEKAASEAAARAEAEKVASEAAARVEAEKAAAEAAARAEAEKVAAARVEAEKAASEAAARAEAEKAASEAAARAEAEKAASEAAARAEAEKAASEAAARAEAEKEAAERLAALKEEAEAAGRVAQAEREAEAAQEAATAKERKPADRHVAKAEGKRTTKTTPQSRACERRLDEAASAGIIYFDRASADIEPSSHMTIARLSEIIKACPGTRIEVSGFADAEGEPERNQNLSERRARAVVKSLIRAGVASTRLTAVGYGADKFVAPNDTPENMARNRRIEFKVFSN